MGKLNKETNAIELSHKCRMYVADEYSNKCFYILGMYGDALFVYADSLQDAFDYLADETTELNDMYTDVECEEDLEDTFPVGSDNYLVSWEWQASEVTRKEIKEIACN